MYCRNCGQELTDGVDFCFNCGYKAGEGNDFCIKCGVRLNGGNRCINCGESVNTLKEESNNTNYNNINYSSQNGSNNYQNQSSYGNQNNYGNNGQSRNRYGNNNYANGQNVYNGGKSRIAAGILGILLGSLGIHRFYLGYIGLGIAQIAVTFLTCGFGSIWGFIEGILILCGTGITTDANGNQLCD